MNTLQAAGIAILVNLAILGAGVWFILAAAGCVPLPLRAPQTHAERHPVDVVVYVWGIEVAPLSVECDTRIRTAPVYPSGHRFPAIAREEAVHNTVAWLEQCEGVPGYWVAVRALEILGLGRGWHHLPPDEGGMQ